MSNTETAGIMKTARFLTLVVALVVTSDFLPYAAAKPLSGRQPNIVFILADDLGWKDLSNEGSTFYESPNIDRIAREGMKFTRGYAACQVCSPSRASILTGKYPTKHGITTWIGDASGQEWRTKTRETPLLPAVYEHQLRPSEITLAGALRAAGYRTFFAGKWHLGGKGSEPTDHGFEINRGGWSAGSPAGGYFSPYKNPNLDDGPPGESLPMRLGRETADFIAANRDQPFLAYLSFYSVHAPLETTMALWKKYRDKAMNAGANETRERFLWDRRLSVRQVQDHPVYAGMIEAMDRAVGVVLAKLDELGIAENTIVCFTSDNGGVSSGDAFATSNLPLRGGKGRQWEGGIREPFYIRAPGVTKAGATSAIPVHGIDWYPTLLELLGVAVPGTQMIDGVSLVPILKGDSIPARPLFWHYPHYGNQGGEPSSIITETDWKLIHYHEDGRDELYHLAVDPAEQRDLAVAQPDRAKQMRAKLDAWLKLTGAKYPTPNQAFDAAKSAALLDALRTSGQAALVRTHAAVLQVGYTPNKDWWGSSPED
jgi:arylsulfatase A-like enzyme